VEPVDVTWGEETDEWDESMVDRVIEIEDKAVGRERNKECEKRWNGKKCWRGTKGDGVLDGKIKRNRKQDTGGTGVSRRGRERERERENKSAGDNISKPPEPKWEKSANFWGSGIVCS
jgi:hypothetical protein